MYQKYLPDLSALLSLLNIQIYDSYLQHERCQASLCAAGANTPVTSAAVKMTANDFDLLIKDPPYYIMYLDNNSLLPICQ